MKPVIGIICSEHAEEDIFFLRQDYVRALEQAGAVPIVLPVTENRELLKYDLSFCQGILLSGGGDISPEFLETDEDEKALFCGIDRKRDVCELFLIQQAAARKIPLLGICRGAQMLNAAFGGTLVADLPPTFGHMQQEDRSATAHILQVTEDSLLRTLTAERFPKVNSFHHQAVSKPGHLLKITAYAPDGTAEAIEHTALPFCVGVQWHPEALQDDFSRALFSSFVWYAAHTSQKRRLVSFQYAACVRNEVSKHW